MNVLYQQSLLSLLLFCAIHINLSGQLLFENFENHTCPDFCDEDLNTVGCLPGWEHWYGSPSINGNPNNNPVDGTNYLYMPYFIQPELDATTEGAIANIPSGDVGDLLSLCFQLYYKGDHGTLDNVVYSVYLANNVVGVNPPFGTCVYDPPGFNGASSQEIASVPASEVSSGWQTIFLPEIIAEIDYNQLVFTPRIVNTDNIAFFDNGAFMLDLVELEELESPFIQPGVSLSSVEASWCDEDEVSVTYEVCSSVPVEIELTASSSAASLIAIPSTQTISLPSNGQNCMDVVFNYTELEEIDQGTAVTFSVDLVTSYLDAICDYSERSDFSHVYEKDCFPEFTCPCEGPNAVNIDAGDIDNGEQLLISNSDLAGLFVPSAYSNNTYFNTCLAIRGRLIIDGDYALVGGEIRMQPGSEIVVGSGDKLSIAETQELYGGGSIHSCEQMWRGIRVDNGGEILFLQNEIRDAQYAIQFESSTTVDIRINNFFDNYVGLYKPPTGGGPDNIVQPFPLAINRFSTLNGLLSEYNGQTPTHNGNTHAGVLIHDCRLLEVGLTGNPFSANVFDDMENGIIAYNSGLSIHESRFEHLIGDFNVTTIGAPPLEALGIASFEGLLFEASANTFDAMERGIHLQNFIAAPINVNDCIFTNVQDGLIVHAPIGNISLDIGGNDIEFRQYGVALIDAPALALGAIKDNTIKLLPEGNTYGTMAAVRLSNSSPSSPVGVNLLEVKDNIIELSDIGNGIYIDESDNTRIIDNDITYMDVSINYIKTQSAIYLLNSQQTLVYDNTLNDNNTGTMPTHGISVRESENSTICCNYTDGHTTGTYFRGGCGDTHYRHTSINEHDVGLHYTSNAITGEQNAAGNSWLAAASYADVAARHEGIAIIIDLSLYSAHPSTWPGSVDLPNAGAAIWFELGPDAPESCLLDEACREAIFPTRYTHLDSALVDGILLALMQDVVLDWRAKQYLYHKIKENYASLPSNPLMNAFYTLAQSQPVGKLDSIAAGIKHLIDHNSTHSSAISENREQLLGYLSAIREIDGLLALASTAQDSVTLWGQRQIKVTAIQTTIGIIDSFSNLIETERMIKAGQLLSYNQGITTSNDPATYEKTVNQVYLNHIFTGSATFSPVEYQTLLNIAQLCPDEGGRAVGFARALLFKETSLEFDDESLCNNQGLAVLPHAPVENYETQKLWMIPNPAKDFTRVIWPDEKHATSIAAYRMDGTKVLSENLAEDAVFMDLNISQWPTGIYIIHVEMLDGSVQTGKLVK